jgi:hypothetical protein
MPTRRHGSSWSVVQACTQRLPQACGSASIAPVCTSGREPEPSPSLPSQCGQRRSH